MKEIKEAGMAKTKLFVLLAAFAVAAGFLAKVYWDAKSPSSVKVTVYKVELMADRSDPRPQVVFSSAEGREIDLVTETGDFMGEVRVLAGVYNRIRLTVKNGFTMSIGNAESNPCRGAAFTDRVFSLDDGNELNSQVPVYFAADRDGGGAWVGSQITNLMIRPWTISRDRTTQLKMAFVVADTLFCPGGEVQRRAPWSVWPENVL